MTGWIVAIVALALLGALLYWELVYCEGAHLGPGVVAWLYDVFAPRYDGVKHFDDDEDAVHLVWPLLTMLAGAIGGSGPTAPFVLDVATGTGRLPLALLREPGFSGRVIGLDLSRGMLARAALKLAPYGDRGALVRHPAVPLPFPDTAFDAVTCLEALEFMPDVREPLREFARVLRPGGVLIVTRRKSRLLLGHTQDRGTFERMLSETGFESIESRAWQVDYTLVWARRPGRLTRQGVRLLEETLCCPRCMRPALAAQPGELVCTECGARVPVGPDGVVDAALSSSRP